MSSFKPWFLCVAFASVLPFAAQAAATTPKVITAADGTKRDAMVEGAMQCTKYFPRYEREYGIPTHLLSAISSTESGRYHAGLKIRLPWPWTVTSGGKGQYFDTKEQAIAAVKKMKASGVKNIDVGCMQVNLYHHSDAFANLDQAFEPEHNVAYAATFLRRLYDDSHTWKQAASDYHSKTPALGTKYIGLVYDAWFNIIQKLREARLSVPNSSVTAMNDMKNGKGKQYASAKVEPYPKPVAKPAYAPPRMNSIKVTRVADNTVTAPDMLSYARKSRDSGIIVVRPDNGATSPTVSANQPAVVAPVAAVAAVQPAAANAALQPNAGVQATTQTLSVSSDGAKASASVAVPINGVAQAALAPVTGLANAVLQPSSGQTATAQPSQGQVPTGRDSVADSSFGDRRPVSTAQVAYKSGPNFIFAE